MMSAHFLHLAFLWPFVTSPLLPSEWPGTKRKKKNLKPDIHTYHLQGQDEEHNTSNMTKSSVLSSNNGADWKLFSDLPHRKRIQ